MNDAVVHLLEPLREPPPVPFWPPAPGWWIAGLIVLTLLILSARWIWQRYKRGAPIRQAKHELQNLQSHDLDDAIFCERLAVLQRRVVASRTSQSSELAATGSQWADILNALTPTIAPFDSRLVTLHYSPAVSETDKTAALEATQRWLSAIRN